MTADKVEGMTMLRIGYKLTDRARRTFGGFEWSPGQAKAHHMPLPLAIIARDILNG